MLARRLVTFLLGFLFLGFLSPSAAHAGTETGLATQAAQPDVHGASLMPPPPDCFSEYASLYTMSYNSSLNVTNGRVNVYSVPSYATVYIQVNGGNTIEKQASSRGFLDYPFTAIGYGANVYVSVWSGNYWVCSGTGAWPTA